MAALRKTTPLEPQVDATAPPLFEEMRDPLHPMHQELLRRISTEPATGVAGLSHPSRFAAIFYFGVAAWGVVGLGVAGIVALL